MRFFIVEWNVEHDAEQSKAENKDNITNKIRTLVVSLVINIPMLILCEV